MPAKQIVARAKASKRTVPNALKTEVQSVLATLKRLGNSRFRADMETRYGIVTKDAFGVRMNEMQRVAKQLGRNHALALALWETGNYEARTVAAFVAEPERVTPTLMDRWCRDFDNWAICDTVCFKLFDQLPHASGWVEAWANRKDEFQKRAAFALLASLALHDKDADDKAFTKFLPLIEAAATDERNFVKKGVSWALRAIGGRSASLKSAATTLARKLAASEDSAARWIGKDALRSLT
jgi:3-methyladenine DNA glycosylase AlkD